MGVRMSESGFNQSDVDLWNALFVDNRPSLPTTAEAITASDVPSIAALARNTGLCLRLRTSDGQDITLNLNAVSAVQLCVMLVQAGRLGNWMKTDGSINIPPASS